MKDRKNVKLGIIALILIVMIVIGSTYAWLTLRLDSDQIHVLKSGSLDLILDDETSEGIRLEKAIPQSYQQGTRNTKYSFKLVNRGKSSADYKISLEDLELNVDEVRMDDSKVRVRILTNDEESLKP